MSNSNPVPIFDTLLHHDKSAYVDYPFQDDLAFASRFIYSYRGSDATFNTYRREVERLLQWCANIAKKSLRQLKHHDIENYLQFCQSPPDTWIALRKYPRFIEHQGQRIPNANWRPFVATVSKAAHKVGKTPNKGEYFLSQQALQAIFAILSSFYNYLIQEDYMEYNPVGQIRQKSKFIRKVQKQMLVRRLSELQWSYIIETAEIMAAQDPLHERTLFIMNILFGMYLRISELAASERWTPVMNHFFRDSDGHWWFRTVGKGNKERQIVVSDAMLNSLKRYRSSLGLSPLPDINDHLPLIFKSRGKGPISSTRHIRTIVQYCFDQSHTRMVEDGFLEEAEQLQEVTVHWLRHTGISEDVKRRPREHVRDDAGHSSSAVTDKYIDIELRARHASGKSKIIKPEES